MRCRALGSDWSPCFQVNTHHIHSSSDDEGDFKDGGFHQDSSLQQVRHSNVPTVLTCMCKASLYSLDLA